MSDSHSPARANAPFALCALVPVTVGRTAVNLYPVIDQGMPPHERAHAFHINITALSSQSIDLRAQLDALGHQLNLSVTVDGVIQDWLRHFYDRWSDFNRLSILSFHNTKGTQAVDTTDAADTAILPPVVDGAITECRKNVKFVRVQLSISFLDLVTVANPGPTTLRTEYYIELPQTSRPMTNGAGVAYNLTTFHGTADLRTLTEEQVRAEILDFTLQDGPVELQPASFGVTNVRTDSLALCTEIESKILRLAYKTICNTLFIDLCPGYSNQPHAALDHIRQVHSDRGGNPVISSVQSFYQQLMSASRPFQANVIIPSRFVPAFKMASTHVSSLVFFTSSLSIALFNLSTLPINERHSRKCCKPHSRPRMIFSWSLMFPAKLTDYPRHFQLQPPEVSATKPRQAHNQVKPRIHSPATPAVEVTPRNDLPPQEGGKVSGSTAALAVAGLIRGLSFAMASTW